MTQNSDHDEYDNEEGEFDAEEGEFEDDAVFRIVFDEDAEPPAPDQRPAPSKAAEAAWTGDEMTMAETPVPPPDDQTVGTWTGDEMTMAEKPVPPGSSTAQTWLGEERTLDDSAGAAWKGDEGTLLDQGDDVDTDDGKPWQGVERTQAGPADMREARAAKAAAARAAREAKETQAKSDGLWHTAGRQGPCTGMHWGDYEVGAVLGEGGMGIVYKGRQLSLNRRVAIKVLPPAMSADPTLRERFEMESRTASLLQSPHVVQVYAAGQEGDHLYFVMEYVEGHELSDVIRDCEKQGQKLTAYEAGDYILQAAKGLQEAQRNQIVHRDIKPANLMVTSDGLVKIADFGIVKVVGEHTLTMTGTAVGTPSYVSPEQGRGDSTDGRADLYSLGVVFYELLTGERPFKAATPNALIYQHCYTEPKLPSDLNPEIPEDYEKVVIKCLQKIPDERYPDAGALVQDLERIQIGHSPMVAVFASGKIGTGADAAMRANMNWFQRHFWAIAASLIAILFLGGGGMLWYQLRQDRAAELRQILAPLDETTVAPDGARDYLDELAGIIGEDDTTVARWQEKIDRILEYEKQLRAAAAAGLLEYRPRQTAETQLQAYEALVGTTGTLQDQVRERFRITDAEIERQRTRLGELAASSLIPAERRSETENVLTRYSRFVADDDPLLVDIQSKLQATEERIASLRQQLDTAATQEVIPGSEQDEFSARMAELKQLAGDQDPELERYRSKLRDSRGHITRLRNLLSIQLADQTVIAPATEQAIQEDFNAFTALVPPTDPDLLRWTELIARSKTRLATWQSTLRAYQDRELIPEPRHDSVQTALQELEAIVGADNDLVVASRTKLQTSRRRGDRAREIIPRLDDDAALTVSERERCRQALNDLIALEAIDNATASRYEARITAEAQRIDQLRRRCADFDNPITITPEMRTALSQLVQLAGSDDETTRSWLDKDAQARQLQQALSTLDQAAPVPEEATPKLDQLATLVGNDDNQIKRWRQKIQRIDDLREALQPVDLVAPLPAHARPDLQTLIGLVGERPANVQRWRTKIDRVATLKQAAKALDTAYVLPSDAEQQVPELIALVSSADTDAAQAQKRLRILQGPNQPSWASTYRRDEFGLLAELRLDDIPLRLRYVPAGRFILGAADDAPGREADERHVPVRLSRSLWLAEHELTQTQWQTLMPNNPSRFRSPDHPIERISWHQAQAYCQLLSERIAGVQARLPTEAEWEYACRSGYDGNWIALDGPLDIERLGELAVYNGSRGPAPVGQRLPNPLGLYDLHGNIWEWCQDAYGPYPANASVDPIGRQGEARSARGGSWADQASALRATNRVGLDADMQTMFVGLRLVVEVTEAVPEVSDLP